MFDGRMEALAAQQHGLVTRLQLRGLGLSRGAIRHRVDSGLLQPVTDGVYRLPGALDTPRLRAAAAVLGGGPEAALSHNTGATWLHLPGYSIDPVTISIPRARRERSAVRVEQSLALPAHHIRVVDGIRCTSIARTIFDLCGDVHPRKAERTMDFALSRQLVTRAALWRVLDDLAVQGRKGVVLCRALLMERGPRYVAPESELEARFIELVVRHGLPEPARQVDLGNADEWIGRVDFVWREPRLVVEVDGAAFHDGLVDKRADEERDARLTGDGWDVLRYRWADVVAGPEVVAAELRRYLTPFRSGIRLP
jgi:hypothetical protein